MMNYKTIILVVVLLAPIWAGSCSKDEPDEPGELVFQSLVAEKDTIAPGETVKVKATAIGNRLEYYWSASPFGDILGSGAGVTYAASPCGVGTNRISCRITSGSTQEETKTIDIVVYE